VSVMRLILATIVLGLAGCASMAGGGPERGYGLAGGGFGPPQGGGGSGGLSNPLTEDLDADGLALLNVDHITAPTGGSCVLSNDDETNYVATSDSGVTIGVGDNQIVNVTAAGLSLASGKTITGGFSAFRIRKTADQTFTSTGETVTWDTEDLDEAGLINLAGANTKILTAAAACEVDGIIRVRWAADADTQPRWLILKRFNSSDVAQERWDSNMFHGDATQVTNQIMPFKMRLAAGDYLTLQGFNPGGTVDMDDATGTLANGNNAAYCHGTIRLTN
jgi:hypothetical protein